MEREISLFGRQSLSYQISAHVFTTLLCLFILYADNNGEGSEKDTKELFVGLGFKEQENCLGGVG